MEARLVERTGVAFQSIPAAGLHGVGLARLPGNLLAILRGIWASRKILAAFRPDALFFTGGFVAVPMALAGYKIPSLLYVPDIEPGLALKTLSRFARRILLTAEESRPYFAPTADLRVSGYPLRPNLQTWQKAQARQHLGILGQKPVLLVFGGSKGALSINRAVWSNLPALLNLLEVIHISGESGWQEAQQAQSGLSPAQAALYHPYPYLHEDMGAALASADLALSRAGASALGEYPFFGLPAILVPYPYAWRYQKVNADYLANRGAALTLEDAKLGSGLLLTLEKLLEAPEKLESMRVAMRALHTPSSAEEIARNLIELAGDRHDKS